MKNMSLILTLVLGASLLSQSSQAGLVFTCKGGSGVTANFDFIKYNTGEIALLQMLWKSKNGQTMETVIDFKVDEFHAVSPANIQGSSAIRFKLTDPRSNDRFTFTTIPSKASNKITSELDISNRNPFAVKAVVYNSRGSVWRSEVFTCEPKKTKYGF